MKLSLRALAVLLVALLSLAPLQCLASCFTLPDAPSHCHQKSRTGNAPTCHLHQDAKTIAPETQHSLPAPTLSLALTSTAGKIHRFDLFPIWETVRGRLPDLCVIPPRVLRI